jgi:hypothetical protein
MNASVVALATTLAACSLLVPAPPAGASQACWQQLLSDWSGDNRVGGAYPAGCYRQAIRRLPNDLIAYSSAASDIGAALQRQFVLASTADRSAAAAAERVRSHDSSRLPSFPPALLFVAGLILTSSIALALRARRRNY